MNALILLVIIPLGLLAYVLGAYGTYRMLRAIDFPRTHKTACAAAWPFVMPVIGFACWFGDL